MAMQASNGWTPVQRPPGAPTSSMTTIPSMTGSGISPTGSTMVPAGEYAPMGQTRQTPAPTWDTMAPPPPSLSGDRTLLASPMSPISGWSGVQRSPRMRWGGYGYQRNPSQATGLARLLMY